MAIRHRRMQAADVGGCVELLATDRLIGLRYGSLMRQLGSVVHDLLCIESFRAVVFEDDERAPPRLVGVGVSSFLSEDYSRAIKEPPLFWVAPDIVERVLNVGSPLLNDRQLQAANATTGLICFVWHGYTRDADRTRPEVQHGLVKAFVEEHRGYFIRELIYQPENVPMLEVVLKTGGRLWNPNRRAYDEEPVRSLEELVASPNLIGFTREHAALLPVSWISTVFMYQPPRFGFSLSEQRLLMTALAGGTDQQLADALGVTLSAVKKMWRAIYGRASMVLTGAPDQRAGSDSGVRGKEKKQELLAYVRDHPEELRPVSRRLLKPTGRRLSRN
jgi:hypothetical protein